MESTTFRAYVGRTPVVCLRKADLVCYWFEKAGKQLLDGKATRAGLVATNSIRGGANRRALESATHRGRIFDAWSDEPWVIDGAAVRVSLVMTREPAGIDLTSVRRLPANTNVAFIGDAKHGTFDVSRRPGA